MEIRIGSSEKLKITSATGTSRLYTLEPPPATASARISTIYYETLADAVAAANTMPQATITLCKDVALDAKINITGNVTIQGAHKIGRGNTTGTLISVQSGATLTIDDNVVVDGGNNWIFKEEEFFAANEEFKQDLTKQYSGFTFLVSNGATATADMITVAGTLILNAATVCNLYKAHAISASSGAQIFLNENSLISHNAHSEGAALYLDTGAYCTMNGGEIRESYGYGNGGAIYLKGGIMTMNGGIITDNYLAGGNGVVLMVYTNPAQFIMNGGEICYNYGVCGKNSHSPCIYLHSSGVMQLNGGSVHHNIGTTCGGVFVRNATRLEVTGGYIGNNENLIAVHAAHQATYGGKHDIYCVGTTVITGGTFTQNVSEYCAAGYILEIQPDGTYVCVSNPVPALTSQPPKLTFKLNNYSVGESWENLSESEGLSK